MSARIWLGALLCCLVAPACVAESGSDGSSTPNDGVDGSGIESTSQPLLTEEPCDVLEDQVRDCTETYGCHERGTQTCVDGYWSDTCIPIFC